MVAWLIVVILSSTIPRTLLDSNASTGRVIERCKTEQNLFMENEKEYAAEGIDPFFTSVQGDGSSKVPSLARRPQQERIERKYAKEARQRYFECIHNSLTEAKKSRLDDIKEYKELVQECKSEKTVVHCDPSTTYRTIDGTCNNLENPKWGIPLECLERLMPASYDGVDGFRKSVCGGPLPKPRKISLKYHSSANRSSNEYSNMFPFIGQFISHDITDVPTTSVGNSTIKCCEKNVSENSLHPQCKPIRISPDDPFYSQYNITCLNFIRSAPCDSCCAKSKRNQMNGVTSYIDGSVVYGSDKKTNGKLRKRDGTGKLITQHKKAGELLPSDLLLGSRCGSANKSQYCFLAGDRRVDQHTSLMCIHTLWAREHNRIATELKKLNPKCPEEILYQETKKIVVALLQVVVFKEYLPLLIGHHLMNQYDLWIRKEGHTHYNPTVNPTIMVEFNTAAYRLHSLVDPNLTEAPIDGGKKRLRDMYSRVSPIYNNKMDDVLEGLSQRYCQKFDRYVTRDLTNFLYRLPGQPGADMAALNIQRGLDHGLPPYVHCLHFFSGGKTKIRNFADLSKFMKKKNIEILEKLYCDVRDVDMWVGLNSERVPPHMALGPTASKIIAMQLRNLKYGDRFYFEHYGIFTKDQLQFVKNFSLAKLLCENTNITHMQPEVLKLPSFMNPLRRCSDIITPMDLSAWKACTEKCA